MHDTHPLDVHQPLLINFGPNAELCDLNQSFQEGFGGLGGTVLLQGDKTQPVARSMATNRERRGSPSIASQYLTSMWTKPGS